MFVTTLRELQFDLQPESLRCSSSQSWDQGIKIIEHLSKVNYDFIIPVIWHNSFCCLFRDPTMELLDE